MPKEVKITATRHTNNPKDSKIKFSRTFKVSEKSSFKKFIDDYVQGMMARLYRIAGYGAGITGKTDWGEDGEQRMVTL